MEIFTTSESISKYILALKETKLSIGFVPTMGALHKGHFSLIEQCKNENDVCVVSIFVNPIQFNTKADMDTYPSTIKQDKQFLEALNCDILFLGQIYWQSYKSPFSCFLLNGRSRYGSIWCSSRSCNCISSCVLCITW